AIDRGAIDDLADGSDALKHIPSTPAPSHALVGTPVGPSLCVIHALDFISPVLEVTIEAFPNDGLVWEGSQRGGLTGPAVSAPITSQEGCHYNNTSSASYSAETLRLLNASVSSGGQFGSFNALETPAQPVSAEFRAKPQPLTIVPTKLLLVAPMSGQHVAAGGTVDIKPITPPAGF